MRFRRPVDAGEGDSMRKLDLHGRCGIRHCVLASAVAVALAACGGGGGGGGVRPVSPPPTAPPPGPPVVTAPNPAYGKHLELTRAGAAHAVGLTGAGIRIGVVDSGVNRRHPALYPRVVENLVYISASNNDLTVDDKVGHGTAVAQAMAGVPFGAWPGGVAPGAQIVSARIISDNPPRDDGSGQGNQVSGALGLAPIHQDLINRGARIMNNSWGGLYWTNTSVTAQIASEYRPFIASNGGLVVFATGNESRANPSDMAALPNQPGPNGTRPAADLERGWLAVAALDSDSPTRLASYSNACGTAMSYCLVAPGDVVVTGTNDPSNNPSYFLYRGTSLATPLVSGAAALVWQVFPYFDNDLVRQTLLGTATDLGAPGTDAVFGNGLLDIGKAVRGPGRLDWGDVTVTFNGATSTWGNDLKGNGALVKRGTGTLRLDGTTELGGGLQVLAGTVESRATVRGSINVDAAGRFAFGTGVVGNVENRGRVDVASAATGTSLVAATLDGDYRQGVGATLGIQLGTQLQVSGNARIDGGEAQVLGVRGGYVSQSREVFLNAAGGLVGRFDALTAAPGVFLDAALGYDANNAWLDITRVSVTAAARSMSLSPTALGSAERVERAFGVLDREHATGWPMLASDFATAAGTFQRTPSAQAAQRTLESLSGEQHAADATLAMMAMDGGRHALETRLDGIAASPAEGAWGDALQARRALPRLDADASGWLLGQDARIGALTFGVAASELVGAAWNPLLGDRERNRQVEGRVYAQWTSGGAYLLGQLGSGRMDRRLQRQIVLAGEGFDVGSDYSARHESFGLQAGYRFDAGSVTLTPYAGLQSLRMERDGFSEAGAAGFGLSSEGSTLRWQQALAGVRWGRDWSVGATRFDLSGRAEWQRRLSQSGADIDARFTGMAVWSPIVGGGVDRDVGVFGLGLRATHPQWGRFDFGVDARHESGDTHGAAWLGWWRGF